MGLATGAARVAEIPTNIDRFSNGCNLGSRWAIEDPKKRKIIRIWCPRWWSHQIRSSSEGIVTQGLYSYLKNNFWVQKMQFRRFLKKPPAATFFVNWFWKWLPRPFQRCRNRQWYILFHLNFILHHCVVSMILTQTGQWGAVGTKSGPPWPSKDLWGPQKDLLWPKRALFASFWSFSQTGWFYMYYNSARWAEHSAAILWTPHKPIFRKKIPTQNWPVEI